MYLFKHFSVFCFLMLMTTLAFGQQPQAPAGGAPEGGGAAMEGKTYNVDALFAALDTDKDTYLSADEVKAAGISDMFVTFADSDKDSQISLSELGAASFPEQMDGNSDGKLEVGEILEFEKSMSSQGGAPGGAPEGGAPQ